MSEISILAIDLAKNSFQVCGVRSDGVVVFNRAVSRGRLVQLLADQPPCIVAMEACATSHHWGRVAMGHGHDVRLIPANYVKPFVKRQKNDFADAAAIAEAASRPSMSFVAVKSAEKQGRAVADVQGDVDAFIAQFDPSARRVPNVAAAIAERLLAAGRPGDALGFIERAEVDKYRWIPREWQDVRTDVLEALVRNEEAQAFRWTCFQRELSTDYLRAYLKRLPDFADIDAEERALDHAAAHPDLLQALDFFLAWPALERAARLLIDRQGEINGDHYEFLVPAAESLSERYPLAATLALRAMINFTLNEARSKRYGYVAEHLVTCADLADRIEDYVPLEPHEAYVAMLRREHGKKSAFWGRSA